MGPPSLPGPHALFQIRPGGGTGLGRGGGRHLLGAPLGASSPSLPTPPHDPHFPHILDLGSLPAGVGLPAGVFSLPKGADPAVSSQGDFRQRGLGPQRGREVTQLFPQPRGAGSTVHSSMGAPGKDLRPAQSDGRLRRAGPALPFLLGCLLSLWTSAASPSHPGPPCSSFGFSPSRPPCSEGSRGGTQAGLVVGSSGEDQGVGDRSQGCRWVGRLSELLGFSVCASVRGSARLLGVTVVSACEGGCGLWCVR